MRVDPPMARGRPRGAALRGTARHTARRQLATLLLGAWVSALALVLPASATEHDTVVRLDDFQRTLKPLEVYGNWDLQKITPLWPYSFGERTFFQFVHEPDGTHYVHLKSGWDNSFSLGLKWDKFEVRDWTVLEWEWKVTLMPTGGDVRVRERDDQAGSMCVIVDPGLVGFDSLCYLWQESGPKDTPIISSKRSASRYLILRTAQEDGIGKWYAERRNILADFRRTFGGDPRELAIIGVQIDSESTRSAGEVFYRNMYRRRR